VDLGEREVAAIVGDFVGGDGFADDGCVGGAERALQVFELDDGDAGAGGGLEQGGVLEREASVFRLAGGWRLS
jgi:hypothetical protein